jgi:hypothetical protein
MLLESGAGAEERVSQLLRARPRLVPEGSRSRNPAAGLITRGSRKRDAGAGLVPEGSRKRDAGAGLVPEGSRKRDPERLEPSFGAKHRRC